jgi:polar amino acid transport system substrate-binding protein
VGYANDIPFGHATADGKLTGEAPEIVRKILSRMGIGKIEGVLVEFDSLIPALKAGRFDMIAAGMFIIPERCREIAFSEPTFRLGQAFLVKKGNPLNLHRYEDVAKNPNAILCVMKGAVEGSYARAVGIPESRIFIVPDTPSGLVAVKNGVADALALTSLSIQNLVSTANDPGIERAQPFSDPVIQGKAIRGYGAFGFRKDDRAFLDEFNKHLKEFIGTKEHLETVQPFGFTETELPGQVTTAELCNSD